MPDIRKSFCRNCGAQCGVELHVQDGQITQLRGDRENPLSKGYFCIKGLASKERQNGQGRLLASQKRSGDEHTPISTENALDEVAAKLSKLTQLYGSRSIGLYYGTGAYGSSLAISFAKGWMSVLGSPQIYSSQTIDQSPKNITALRMGAFKSGRQPFATADVWLISGSNPVVSHLGGWGGNTMYAPATDIRMAKKRGLKLIVIDPRQTETARMADIHLQLRPGQDVAIYAAMLNIIMKDGAYDHEFCTKYVKNLDRLKRQAALYTPEFAAEAAGVAAADIVKAARLFARGPRGCAVSGTGPNMAPHANLAEHLLECLNVICGRYRRAGEQILNAPILSSAPIHEGVYAPYPIWDHSPKMASHPDVGWALPSEYPSNLLVDEIMHKGEDRLRALIVLGGNPLAAIPDYKAVSRAFSKLELLVTLDVQMSETAQVSDYVISCKTPYERADLSLMSDGNSPVPAVEYTEPVIPAPLGAMEEWEIFYELSRRMGLELSWEFWNFGAPTSGDAMKLDMTSRPSTDDLFRFVCRHPEAGFDRIKASPVGQILDITQQVVLPASSTDEARLDLMPDEVAAEFEACRASGQRQKIAPDELLLHSRRLLEALNSNFIDSETTRARCPMNPVYMNPSDMASRGLTSGDAVEVYTNHGRLSTIVKADPTERTGSVSMHHSWGRQSGQNGNQMMFPPISIMIDRDLCRENHNFIPRMSALPVRVRREPAQR